MNELGVFEPHEASGYSRTTYKQLFDCPMCGGKTGTEMHSERLPVVGIGEVYVGYGFCVACGHIYQTSPVPPGTLGEYYRKFSNYTLQTHPEIARLEWPSPMTERFIRIIRDHIKGLGTLYEVGCATGKHLHQFKQRGWKVSGCDPSPKACEQAKAVYEIDVECGLEAECLPKHTNLDAILFSGVLEHLTDPAGALRRAREALKYNGHVIVEVPCAVSPGLLPPGWFAFEHLHYYTPQALHGLLARTGFEVIESRISFRDFIYPVITCVAQRRDGGKASSDPVDAYRFITEYLKRDDDFWIEAENRINGTGFVIWGAGIHTSQLFDRIPWLKQHTKYIVDRDPQKCGSTLAGHRVTIPDMYFGEFADVDCNTKLIISSYANEADIVKELAAKDVPESLIVRLYT